MSGAQIHPLADVQSESIGDGTRIWQFVVVLPGASIGKGCNICSSCFIENDVTIGNNVTVKNGVSIYDGVRLEDDVFVGPNATFTNDPMPRSGRRPVEFAKTVVKRGASIGANATLLPGIVVGEGALVAAGSTVTRDVPPHCVVMGNPARIRGVSPAQAKTPERASQQVPVAGVKFCDIPSTPDARGGLVHAEFGKDLPFVPVRYFLLHGISNNANRGDHAHKSCAQFFVALSGSCRMAIDDGRTQHEVLLDDPARGLLVPAGTWCVLYDFTDGASILVFASEPYDADEYIRSYDEFRAFKNR